MVEFNESYPGDDDEGDDGLMEVDWRTKAEEYGINPEEVQEKADELGFELEMQETQPTPQAIAALVESTLADEEDGFRELVSLAMLTASFLSTQIVPDDEQVRRRKSRTRRRLTAFSDERDN